MQCHHDIVSFTVQSAENEMPFLCSVDANIFTVAAFDNFDHNKDTLSGIGLSHATVAVMFQRKTDRQKENQVYLSPMWLIVQKPFYAVFNCPNLQNLMKPKIKPQLSDDFNLMTVTLY